MTLRAEAAASAAISATTPASPEIDGAGGASIRI